MENQYAPSASLPTWIKPLLGFTALYHVAWGLFFVLRPAVLIEWTGWAEGEWGYLVQGLGGGLMVLSVGYALAAYAPLQHWGFVLIGCLLKGGAAIGTSLLLLQQVLPPAFWGFTLLNDVAWLLPFGAILYQVYRFHPAHQPAVEELPSSPAPARLAGYTDQHGRSLAELQETQKLLLVFLRHFGCTFCRETMADLARDRALLEAQGLQIVVVHQSPPERADAFFARYGLADMARVSDPAKDLYAAFALYRGSISQMFGWKSWLRGIRAGVWDGHWVGREEGDGWQMPGAFLLERGQILRAFRHQSAADRPDYEALACERPGVDAALSHLNLS